MNISNLPEVASKSYDKAFLVSYLEILSMLERLHRLMLDIINDEFKRGQILEINSVQGLLIFNIGDDEVAAGELKSRGYYQGSNVSYNLKKLVELDYVHYQRCDTDRRSFRVRLTEKGQHVRDTIQNLMKDHAKYLEKNGVLGMGDMHQTNGVLKRVERHWIDQIRFVY